VSAWDRPTSCGGNYQDQLNQAWYADQAVQYFSSSQGLWLDATVLHVHTDGHVTIDIRGRVSEAKIRPRVPVSDTVVVVLSRQGQGLPPPHKNKTKNRGQAHTHTCFCRAPSVSFAVFLGCLWVDGH
jgi:hypothetical protein